MKSLIKKMLKKNLFVFASATISMFTCTSFFTGCSKEKTTSGGGSIAIFIPGIAADSPIYANLEKGVQNGVDEYNATAPEGKKATVTVLEAGTNQAEWSGKLTALAATGTYDVIISSNPALPELCAPLTQQFPSVRFILLNAENDGNDHIFAVNYNQKEQSYLTGYIAGLMSKTHKVGLIAAQEYPDMDNILLPYYTRGAQDSAKGTTVDFRIVGNWYDASKGAELADAMCAAGVDVILPICGGASQGVINSAKAHQIHLNWFDENGFSKAPGTIISSCMVKQDVAAKEATLDYLNGKTTWGTTKVAGITEGYIEFVQDDPLYQMYVPEAVRMQLDALVQGFKSGSVSAPELN